MKRFLAILLLLFPSICLAAECPDGEIVDGVAYHTETATHPCLFKWTIGTYGLNPGECIYNSASETTGRRDCMAGFHSSSFRGDYYCIDVTHFNTVSADTDNDGIDCRFDPYPDDDTPFAYKPSYYQLDENSDYAYLAIETDRGDTFHYGTHDPSSITYMDVESNGGATYNLSQDDFSTMVNDPQKALPGNNGDSSGWYKPPLVGAPGEAETGTSKGLESGVGSVDSGSADSARLDAIISNTNSIANNQVRQADYMAGIKQGVDILIRDGVRIRNPGDISGGSGSSLDSVGVADGVKAALDAKEAENDASGQATESSIAALGNSYETTLDTVTSDAEKSEYEQAVADFTQNNPLKSISDQVGISLSSPQSSMSTSVYGADLTFNFGTYDWYFSMVGNILVGLAYLTAFFIVVRG